MFFLEHILESIALIEEYVGGADKDEFADSTRLQDMVSRRLEIIGEAVKNLPDDIKERHTDIPWKKIAGMRDVLIHSYFGIDLDLTWGVIEKDIPELKMKIKRIIDELSK